MAAVVSEHAVQPISDPSADSTEELRKISAYYSLVFPNFTYYLQTLNVTIGRRCTPSASASSSQDAQQVDVDLGPLKSVSRLHARIEYEEEEERFVLIVMGRNGAWVDGVWSGSGSKVPLGERYVSSPTLTSILYSNSPGNQRTKIADSDSLPNFPLRPPAPSSPRGLPFPKLTIVCQPSAFPFRRYCRYYLLITRFFYTFHFSPSSGP